MTHDIWYRAGRYFSRGPKRGTEEENWVVCRAPRCDHTMEPGLDTTFSICANSCGRAEGPMTLREAGAIAQHLRNTPRTKLSQTERALLCAFALIDSLV